MLDFPIRYIMLADIQMFWLPFKPKHIYALHIWHYWSTLPRPEVTLVWADDSGWPEMCGTQSYLII